MNLNRHALWRTAFVCSAVAGILMQLVMLGSPYVGDEASNIQLCRRLAFEGLYASEDLGTEWVQGRARGLEFDGYITTGPTVLAPIGLAYRWFGEGPSRGRAVMLIYFVASIFAFRALARRLAGDRAADIAAAIYATYPLVVEAGHRVLGEMAGLCFIFAGLCLLLDYFAGRGAWRLALGAFCFGLAGTSKVLAYIAVFGTVVWLAGWATVCLRNRDRSGLARRLAEIATVCTIAALPMLAWFAIMVWRLGWDGFMHNHLGYTASFFTGGGAAGGSIGFVRKLFPRLSWVTWAVNNAVTVVFGALALVHFMRREGKRHPDWLLLVLLVSCFWLTSGMHRYSLYLTGFLICIIARYIGDLCGDERIDLLVPTRPGSMAAMAGLVYIGVNVLTDARFIYLGEPGHEYWFTVIYYSVRLPFWEIF